MAQEDGQRVVDLDGAGHAAVLRVPESRAEAGTGGAGGGAGRRSPSSGAGDVAHAPTTGPRVTVAIPTRNRARYLRECLASVLDQSLRDIEVFVSDNASTDDTAEIVAAFGDPRVHHVPTGRDISAIDNFNRCLDLGTAPYLVVLGDDDVMLPGNLERKVALLDANPSVAFVHSAFRRIDERGVVWPGQERVVNGDGQLVEPGGLFVARTLQRGSRVNNPSVVYRRAALTQDRFEPADDPFFDAGLWLRLARHHDVGYLPEVLVAFRVHGRSQTDRHGLRRVRRGRPAPTRHHADLVRRVNERFLDGACYDEATARRLRALVRRNHRASRWLYELHGYVPGRLLGILWRALRRLDPY